MTFPIFPLCVHSLFLWILMNAYEITFVSLDFMGIDNWIKYLEKIPEYTVPIATNYYISSKLGG